ncbi:PIG-L deacetylase family protein [Nonomuraea africana]|uniref:LmbE family N-acetylglucosaminyl deacetylase n=1 Tax=Nonomuraea africana TaxID=46171 RepID=A0ABR9KSJ9_9ACTN|nr:PIG-L family deacetylase [Nonomuraea africana]MBE1565010.1 LmbE family N-acetylglucosaminyl deacetylase [Nonomuraea africana]
MLRLFPERSEEIVLLGAHCDDIAIGAGATLLGLCGARPGLRVRALVLSGAGTAREAEERAALSAFCPKADLEVRVLDVPDGRLPSHWERAKEALHELRARCDPGLVLAPAPHDAHQDHRGLARLVPTVFRDHHVLGYEILKWESDLAQPNVFVPVAEGLLAEKIGLLHEHYPSQHDRSWFDAETFGGLARVRGVQCQSRYAEAFHTTKLVLSS